MTAILARDSAATRTETVKLSGHDFRVLVAGAGAPVVALHGFPDSADLWRYQMAPLAAAGYQVIAPDLRGFGESWKPQDVASYAPLKLLSDVVGIMQHFKVRRAHVVGHDFGAFVAWALAAFMPRRVNRLVTMSVGHPAVWAHPNLEQRRRFWYSLLYIHPQAEQVLRQRNWELLRELTEGERDSDRFLRGLQRPGALTAAMNWYRANCQPTYDLSGSRSVPPVSAPTMALLGGHDLGFTEQAMQASQAYVTGEWKYVLIEDAGHYIPVDAPDRVAQLLLDWFGPAGDPSAAPASAQLGGRR